LTVERVVDESTKFITHWSLCRSDEKMCGLNKQKLVAMATSLEQPNFTAIIYAHKATNSEKFAKISRILSEITGLEPIVKTGSCLGS